MHSPGSSDHDDELVDRLLERLEALAQAHPNESFDELASREADLHELLAGNVTLAARLRDEFEILARMQRVFSSSDSDERFFAPPGYQILDRLGHGGAGVVYRARQLSLGREVALKVMLGGRFASDRAHQRFRREAETAARLQHSHIAQIYDHGEFEGLPFLSQELVPGGSLAERIERQTLAPHEAARLVETLARAVHYAHQCGVIHRDLKPANVLLDDAGDPKIIDFGLAKAEFDTHLTRTGEAPGTPSYMAPEQIEGLEAGPPTDVYGLGTILYDALVGGPPFVGTSIADVYGQVLRAPADIPRALWRMIPADLRAITLKCLEKNPKQRYECASALADDLRRWSQGLPVAAKPLGTVRRAIRWAQRRPAAAALVAVSTFAATVVFVGSILYSINLTNLNRVEGERRQEAEARRVEAETNRRELEKKQRTLNEHLYASNVPLAQKAYELNNLLLARELLAQHLPQTGDADLRGFAWYLVDHLCNSDRICLRGHTGEVFTVCYAADGRTLATCGQDGTVRLWNAADGRSLAVLRGHQGELQCLAYSPDGKWIASGDNRGIVQFWNVEKILQSPVEPSADGLAPSQHEPPQHPPQTIDLGNDSLVWSLAFSRDGARLAIGSQQSLIVRDVAAGTEIRTWNGYDREIRAVVFDPSGQSVYFAAHRKIWVGDIRSGETTEFGQEHSNSVNMLALTRDGNTLASADQSGQVKIWDLSGDRAVRATHSQSDRVDALAFSPDDRVLAIGGKFRTIELWNLADDERVVLRGHTATIWSTEFSPDGSRLASASADGTIRIWEPRLVCPRKLPASSAMSLAFSPNSETLAVGDNAGKIRFWNWADGQPLAEQTLVASRGDEGDSLNPAPAISGLTYSANGDELFALVSDDRLDRWDLHTRMPRESLCVLTRPAGIGRARDRDVLAIWSGEGGSRFWPVDNKSQPDSMIWPLTDAKQICFTADGNRVVALDRMCYALRMLRTNNGVLERAWRFPPETGNCLALSPDGLWAATGGSELDRAIYLWNVASGRLAASFVGHDGQVTCVGFCPDGRTLVSTSTDGSLRLWDLRMRKELFQWQTEFDHLDRLEISPDGRAVAAIGSADAGPGEVLVWSVRRDAPVPRRPVQVDDSKSIVTADQQQLAALQCRPEEPGYASYKTFSLWRNLVVAADGHAPWVSPQELLLTFEERCENGQLQMAGLVCPGTVYRQHSIHESWHWNTVPEMMRRLAKDQPGWLHYTAPDLNMAMVVHFLPETIECRLVSAGELEQPHDIFDLHRRMHGWAKQQGYVGGFPTYQDETHHGMVHYGVALIKPGMGREVWVPLAGPIPNQPPPDIKAAGK